MKSLISILFSAFFLFQANDSGLNNTSKNPVKDECEISNLVFKDGEKIVYTIYYNWNFVWIPAGEVHFEVKETNEEYILSAIGNTYPSYEWFYKVRDYYESRLDKQTLLPNMAIRDVREGGYTVYDRIDFDQENQKCTSFRGRTVEKASYKDFEYENCMHDMLSMIYRMRNIEMETIEQNDLIPIRIFLDREVYPLDIRIFGKEENKKIKGMGRFNTLRISPELIDGVVFKEGQQMKMWVSDDENKIPLMIESPVSVGSIKAVIKSYEGLKHPLTSKL